MLFYLFCLKLLNVTLFQVDLGNNFLISKEAWDDEIKTQTRPSFFIKRGLQAHYGQSGLVKRTVGKPRKQGKQQATPQKMETMIGKY